MLSSLFSASASEVTNDTRPVDHPHVDVKPVDTVKLGTLAKILGVQAGPLRPLDTSGEQFVIPVDAALADALAAPFSEVVASTWAATPEWEIDGPEHAAAALRAIGTLAAQAKRDQLALFLWLSL